MLFVRRGLLALLLAAAALSAEPASAMVDFPVHCGLKPAHNDPGVPKLSGRYVIVRWRLQRLGFTPLSLQNPASVCVTRACRQLRTFPEAQCAIDAPLCNMFWRAPNRRVLRIATCGEVQGGTIDSIWWAAPHELARLLKARIPKGADIPR